MVSSFKRSAREAQQSVKDIQRELENTNGGRAFADINSEMEDLRGKVERLKEAISSGKAEKFEYDAQAVVDAYEKQLSSLEKEAEAAKGVKEEIQEAAKASKQVAENMTNASRGQGNFGSSLVSGVTKGIKSLVKCSFAVRSLYALVGKAKSFAVEGIKNLVQASGSTNAAVSSMLSALNQLKNSFATAFAPIIEVVAPYVTRFLRMMSDAVSAVGAFFAALTGKSTFTKAVAVHQDYAASLSSAANGSKKLSNATKEAAKAQKELNRQLMGFDEITKLSDRQDKDNGSKTSGSSGLPPSMMFTEATVPSASDFVQQLKAAWAAKDFAEIGSLIGEKLQSAFVSFDWGKITKALSNILIAGVDFIRGFMEGINWQKLPSDIYDAMVKAIKGVNWKGVRQSLTDAVTTWLNSVISLGAGVLEVGVKLVKSGWSLLSGFVGTNKTLDAGVRLVKRSWTSLTGWIGTNKALSVGIQLVKSGWSSLSKWLGDLSAKFNIKLPKISVEWSGSPIKLPKFSVKWNAQGGILNRAQIFGMMGNTLLGGGEAGREAILPLDRNTGWMDTLAERVAQRISSSGNNRPIVVQVTLDGRVVGQSVVDFVNGQARATGRHPMAAYL